MNHVKRLQESLVQANVPAILVSDITNVQWLTGFSGSSGYALVTGSDSRFVTDSRYTIQAAEEVTGLDVVTFASPVKLTEFISLQLRELNVRELAFERSVSYATWEDWVAAFADVKLTPAPDVIKPLRMVKTSEEVEKIKAACKLADGCLAHVQRMLQPGVSEYDIGLEIEFFFRRNGAEVGFAPIVASGENSARPHARASERKLQPGDFVTLDLGAKLDGYNSDMTRTFVIGKATDRHKEIYDQVLKAEVACCEGLVAGISGKEIDGKAREILDEKDLAKYFGHGLGHGLGRATHDPGGLSSRSEDIVSIGNVWTVEPGVYIEGFGGVRIEDDVLVTENGPEILTHYPKQLIEIS